MDKINKILVIIPTYNEKENIIRVIERALAVDDRISILVVDDGSPDGTGAIVQGIIRDNPRVQLFQRSGKQGLGSAYVTGFKYALEKQFDAVVQMDADFSHNPDDIKNLIQHAENNAQFVIGSRYVSGVNVVNWPLQRLLLSYFASIYSRWVTGMPYHDLTAGFSLIRHEVLKAINLDNIRSNGYSFQIEIKYLSWRKGFRIVECPIIFIERAEGRSKMNRRIVIEAIFMVWKLRLSSILEKFQ